MVLMKSGCSKTPVVGSDSEGRASMQTFAEGQTLEMKRRKDSDNSGSAA